LLWRSAARITRLMLSASRTLAALITLAINLVPLDCDGRASTRSNACARAVLE